MLGRSHPGGGELAMRRVLKISRNNCSHIILSLSRLGSERCHVTLHPKEE